MAAVTAARDGGRGERRRPGGGRAVSALRRKAPTCRVLPPPSTRAARGAACPRGAARRGRLVRVRVGVGVGVRWG